MDTININPDAVHTALTEVKTLQSEWDFNTYKRPTQVGGGGTVSELELLADAYKSLNDHVITLLTNTVSFLENVEKTFVESDNKGAKQFKK